MNFVDRTLPTPEENLEFDEALLHALDGFDGADASPLETLRFWESPMRVVVLGRGGKAATEVRAEVCQAKGIPVLRRPTGGGAVVLGPGCLNFSLVLSLERRPELQRVRRSYEIILTTVIRALDATGLEFRGLSDIAWQGRKISGNAQKRTRRALLHQGTILYKFDSSILAELLPMPPRQPRYRQGRAHADFVTNYPLAIGEFKLRLFDAWRE